MPVRQGAPATTRRAWQRECFPTSLVSHLARHGTRKRVGGIKSRALTSSRLGWRWPSPPLISQVRDARQTWIHACSLRAAWTATAPAQPRGVPKRRSAHHQHATGVGVSVLLGHQLWLLAHLRQQPAWPGLPVARDKLLQSGWIPSRSNSTSSDLRLSRCHRCALSEKLLPWLSFSRASSQRLNEWPQPPSESLPSKPDCPFQPHRDCHPGGGSSILCCYPFCALCRISVFICGPVQLMNCVRKLLKVLKRTNPARQPWCFWRPAHH